MEYSWATLISEHKLAEAFKVSTATLKRLRDKGLPHVKIGAKVFYHEGTTVRWLAEAGGPSV